MKYDKICDGSRMKKGDIRFSGKNVCIVANRGIILSTNNGSGIRMYAKDYNGGWGDNIILGIPGIILYRKAPK